MNDIEAAAEKAELTGQIRSFMTWLGEGRKLTQTGRIALADARHLVALLGTGDRIDPEIGNQIVKTKSSEQLPYLTRVVAWMRAARLIRVTGTRMTPVKKNAGLADRPLDLVLALLEAYPRLGNEYDFGDSWEHELVVEARTVAEDDQAYPACIAGEGACPPEDCGGVYGFAELKDVLAGPDSEERDEMQERIGEDFDPAHFDLAAANAAIAVV